MRPWTRAFSRGDSVLHVVRTEEMVFTMDTGNVLGCQLTQHHHHLLLHSPLHTGEKPGNTFLRSLPLYGWELDCLSEALAQSLEARVLRQDFQAYTSADTGVSRQALENHLLWSCRPAVSASWRLEIHRDFRASFWALPAPEMQAAEICSGRWP